MSRCILQDVYYENISKMQGRILYSKCKEVFYISFQRTLIINVCENLQYVSKVLKGKSGRDTNKYHISLLLFCDCVYVY